MHGLLVLFGKLPLKFHYGLSKVTTWAVGRMLHYRKDVVYINLARAFPEKKYWELDLLVKEFYRHFGEIIAEAVWFSASDDRRLREQRICTVTNPEVLAKVYAESPGVMLMTSHCGNWELLGGIRSYNDRPEYDEVFNPDHFYIAYKEQSSHLWNEVLKKTRVAPIPGFKGLVETKDVLRFILRRRGEKGIYVFIADQSPYAAKTEVGDFMHQHAYGMVGSFGLAHKLGMAVVYSKMVRTERGHYDITFVPLVEDASKHEPEEIMKLYFKELEKELAATPANWLWTHKRWKN